MADTQAPDTELKKRNDAYTGFLAISFLAMVGGTVLLYLEYQNYENKTPPKGPTIDVPGTQLKIQPGSGLAPPKVVEPPKMEEPTMMRRTPPPALLPESAVKPVETDTAIRRAEPVIQIPDVTLPMGIVPASAVESIKPVERADVPVIVPMPVPARAPVIPNIDPKITDDPPLPTQRFSPPPM